MNKLYKASIAVMCAQPLTTGHIDLLVKMASCSERPIIAWGSCQENPPERVFLTIEERKKCVDNIFGYRFEHVILEDIDAQTPEDWLIYVANEFQKQQGFYPYQDDVIYFGGSEDIHWYKQRIYEVLVGGQIHPFIGFKNIQALDRTNNPISGTRVRKMLENYVLGLDVDNPEFKQYTSPCNWNIIENAFRRKYLKGN